MEEVTGNALIRLTEQELQLIIDVLDVSINQSHIALKAVDGENWKIPYNKVLFDLNNIQERLIHKRKDYNPGFGVTNDNKTEVEEDIS